jgi:tripartite-type tricarboxylate transporter receptor subunit TctC
MHTLAAASRRLLCLMIMALSMLPLGCWAQAGFPVKPVRWVIPFDPGSSPDIVGRFITERLTRLWGQQVFVDNRVGAAGVLGSAHVAKAPPDGYTLLQCNIASSAIAVSLYLKMPYDATKDLVGVTRIGMTPNIITVHPSVPIKSLKDLIAYAKKHPGKLSYASAIVGTSPQLSMELLKLMAKIDIVNIPYKIGAQGVNDNIAGQVPVGISNFPISVAPVQSGRLRPIAVTGPARVSQLPDVPTVEESGLPGYAVTSWQGVCAPGATPAALLDKLNADVNGVLRLPEIRAKMEELVMVGPQTARDEFDQFIRAEISRWAMVVKQAGIPQQ